MFYFDKIKWKSAKRNKKWILLRDFLNILLAKKQYLAVCCFRTVNFINIRKIKTAFLTSTDDFAMIKQNKVNIIHYVDFSCILLRNDSKPNAVFGFYYNL